MKAIADRSGMTPNSPITQRLKALDGLVLASPSSSSPYTMALKNSAEAVGAKIRLTYMGQPAMVAALQSGVIQGFVASSPYYAQPVLSGAAVVWVIGPKGEFPPQYTPANSVTLNTRRDFAEANRELMQRMTNVFADLADAVANRPADVKAAVAKLFPDTDTNTLDLLFDIEAKGFNAKPLTVEDMAHEIDFVRQSGQQMAELNQLDPKSLLFQ
jgi:ABC-type nitrate/sulfonate/bicarbonate transport system substrate-binding protein